MQRDLVIPLSLSIGEETLSNGYEEQNKKHLNKLIFTKTIFNLMLNIVLIGYVGYKLYENKKEGLVSLIILSILFLINIVMIISYFYYINQLKNVQLVYEIVYVQVILYIIKNYIKEIGNDSDLYDGIVIGGSMFNVIVGFSFMNKIIMNLYTILSITLYHFTTQNNYSDIFYFTFTMAFIFLSSCREYLEEKHRVTLYTCSKKNNYVGDQIIAHTPVGILATKFDESSMKFELISMNAKAQQLLHLEENQNSLDNFLKSFEIDSDACLLNRSDLSNKQIHSKEQLNNQKKKQDNEMSLMMQCKFHMMKMQPAYPRDLSQRIKKRNNSNGKSHLINGLADKDTDVTTKNNINTHSVIAEVKQFNGSYNNVYLNLQLSTYAMMGSDKYAIFCISQEPYKRDYYNLKNKNQKYQNFFSNFCTSFEKSLICQIKDWKFLYNEFLSTFAHSIISPTNQLLQTTYFNSQQNGVQQNFNRQAKTKKTLNMAQAEQKYIKPIQKNLMINEGGFHKQINNNLEDNYEMQINNNQRGSQYSIGCSPHIDTKQQQFFFSQDNNHQQGSMNFDYFNITQESMNNIQPLYNQIQNIINNADIAPPPNNNNFSPKAGNNLIQPQNIHNLPLNNQSPKSGNLYNNRINNLVFRANYNSHRLMYDYQNWNTLYDLEFGQNVLINQRQSAEQIDIDRVLTRIISIFEVLIIEKQIKIVKQIKVQSIQITQNSKKVHIILYNILHNAFQYCKYQSSIQIIISDNQNCITISVVNEIHQDEENQITYLLQNQILQDSKNLLQSVNLDSLNQFPNNLQQPSDQQQYENGNTSNHSIHLAILARKKGESYGIRLTKFLLRSIGPPDKLKFEAKDQKFTVSFDIFLDVNYQRKKQTSLFQRYKKNSTNNDQNLSMVNQQNDVKQIFETVYYSPTEFQQFNQYKKSGQNVIQNEDVTINVNSIEEYPNKMIIELDDTYKTNDKNQTNAVDIQFKSRIENQKNNEYDSLESDFDDISEQQQSNLQVTYEQSQITASFNQQARIKTIKFQTMQKKI